MKNVKVELVPGKLISQFNVEINKTPLPIGYLNVKD